MLLVFKSLEVPPTFILLKSLLLISSLLLQLSLSLRQMTEMPSDFHEMTQMPSNFLHNDSNALTYPLHSQDNILMNT
jgi:hypothetical protein